MADIKKNVWVEHLYTIAKMSAILKRLPLRESHTVK